MNPAGVEVQEVEDDVADVRDREHEEIVGHQEQHEVEAEIGPHRGRRRAPVVHAREIARQPAVDRGLVQRARGARHRRHDRQQQREDHHDDDDLLDQRAGADELRHRGGHAHAAVDIRREHALESEFRLERERDQHEGRDAEQPRVEDGLEGVRLRVAELACVAHRGLERVGRPRGDEQSARDQRPAGHVPGAVERRAVLGHAAERHVRREMTGRRVARQQRHQRDQHQRHERGNREDHRDLRRAQDAAMLDREGHEHRDGADHEGRVDAQRETLLERAEIEQRDLPGVDRGLWIREQQGQDVAGGETRADREHRRPREPVAPHRHGCEELAVGHPGDGPVHGRAARLAREQARDLRVGEGLQEAEADRHGPHDPGWLADRRGYRADGEQHQRRHAAGDPERPRPVDLPLQLRDCDGPRRRLFSNRAHPRTPCCCFKEGGSHGCRRHRRQARIPGARFPPRRALLWILAPANIPPADARRLRSGRDRGGPSRHS